MTRFSHLILTPFNLRVKDAPGLNPDWLRHRFELFESFCFPSVQAQSNQDFKWLLLMDPDTPPEFKQRIEELSAQLPSLIPIFTTLVDYLEPTLQCVDPAATHLITTNLDNDDALAAGFIDRVQAEFHEQEFELVDLVEGFRLHTPSSRLYRHRVTANPFLTLIEKNESPKTIRGCGPHNLIEGQYDSLRKVVTEPLWLQVVHGRNIAATGIWGCRRVAPSALEGKFTIKRRFADQSGIAIALENCRRLPERWLINLVGQSGATSIRRALGRLRR